jgi:hypothetical protein
MTTSAALSSNPLPWRRSTPFSKEIDEVSISACVVEEDVRFKQEYTGSAELI